MSEQNKCVICGGPASFNHPDPAVRCGKCVRESDLWIQPIPMADWVGDMEAYPMYPPLNFPFTPFYLGGGIGITGMSKSTFPILNSAQHAEQLKQIPPSSKFQVAGSGAFFSGGSFYFGL